MVTTEIDGCWGGSFDGFKGGVTAWCLAEKDSGASYALNVPGKLEMMRYGWQHTYPHLVVPMVRISEQQEIELDVVFLARQDTLLELHSCRIAWRLC